MTGPGKEENRGEYVDGLANAIKGFAAKLAEIASTPQVNKAAKPPEYGLKESPGGGYEIEDIGRHGG